MSAKIIGHDNRGDEEYPYGFVYFDNDTRMAYTSIDGHVKVHPDATGGWPEVTTAQALAAQTYVSGQFSYLPRAVKADQS